MRELLTRRIGPAPVWLWMLVFVIGVAIFLRWRNKGKASSELTSDAFQSPNLTSQPATLFPYASEIYVNITQPVGDTSQTTPTGPRRGAPVPPPYRTGPAPVPIFTPPGGTNRYLSMTYPALAPQLVAGATLDQSRQRAAGSMYGIPAGGTILPQQRLVVPG